jgi:hypothetical protein
LLCATDGVRICANKELALCLDLILGRRIWQVVHRSPVLYGVGSVALCTVVDGCKRLKKTNKEEEVGGCSPTLG